MKKIINIGLIGAGRAGMIHARNFAFRIPGVCLKAVADASAESAENAAKTLQTNQWYTDYHAILEDEQIDAVIVVTPTVLHCQIVTEALKAGKHVFCEKPMAMNEDECKAMIEAASANHRKLQIGFMRRFDKNYIRAKELIDSGAIGDVILVRSWTRGPSVPHEWMYDIDKSNGPLAEVNSHDIDTLRWFTGSEPKSIYAIAGNYRCKEAKLKYPDFYDTVLASLYMENGMLGSIDGAQGVLYGYDAQVNILGTKGSIHIGSLQDKSTLTFTKENGLSGDVIQSWMQLFEEAYFQEDINFIQCIQMDTEPAVTGMDGWMAVKIVNAGNRSLKTKQIVLL